eukprot:362589-Chlamydomonas_euryale.AAC.10
MDALADGGICEMANVDSCWTNSTGDAWEATMNFGSVMSLSKFKSIIACLTLPCPPQSADVDDPFLDVRLCMDACIHAWNVAHEPADILNFRA